MPQLDVKEIFQAAIEGKPSLLQLIIDNRMDPEVRDEQGLTVLAHVVRNGHINLVRALATQFKVNLDCTNGSSRPIVDAAGQGNLELVKMLLKKGADPRFGADPRSDKRGTVRTMTALAFAASRGHNDVVKLLLGDSRVYIDVKTETGLTPLLYAIQNGREDTVRLLLQERANAGVRDEHGHTPLMFAARLQNDSVSARIIMLILSVPSANPKAIDLDGDNAVMHALFFGTAENLRIILAARSVHPQVVNERGQTPVMVAACGCIERLQILLDDDRVDPGKALLCAVLAGRGDNVRLLLESNRMDLINEKNASGQTALMLACIYRHPEMVRLLLATNGFPLNETDDNGQTALMLACLFHDSEIVRILLATGKCNLEVKSDTGETALLYAVQQLCDGSVDEERRQRGVECIHMILAEGNNKLNIVDQYQPLVEWAIDSNVPGVVKMLLDAGASLTLGALAKAKKADAMIEEMIRQRENAGRRRI